MTRGVAPTPPGASDRPLARPAGWPSAWLTPEWPAPANVRALCTTRIGGASGGPWAGLNLAAHVGDDPAAVAANRALLRAYLPAEPVWLAQVHGVCVIDPASQEPRATPPEADAARTCAIDTPCAVLTADCLPVLLCDGGCSAEGAATRAAATEVASIHAGWRGLADGVLEATAAAMRTRPQDWLAWIGPCIGPDAFACDDDVVDAFCAEHPEARSAFRPHPAQPGKWLGDLPAIARQRLVALGVPPAAIHGGGLCTVSDASRFYSFRRDGVTGRMATLVWLAS
ncbi:MAG: peptidoglycan editing factor PgeF [Rhodocyclaceae bacterium]|nr:peptidoglycan editing factor PgeF [Rhodocyclaceae bacterium]